MREREEERERETDRHRDRDREREVGVLNEEKPNRDGRNSDKQLQWKTSYIDLEKDRKIFFIDRYGKIIYIYIYIYIYISEVREKR